MSAYARERILFAAVRFVETSDCLTDKIRTRMFEFYVDYLRDTDSTVRARALEGILLVNIYRSDVMETVKKISTCDTDRYVREWAQKVCARIVPEIKGQ